MRERERERERSSKEREVLLIKTQWSGALPLSLANGFSPRPQRGGRRGLEQETKRGEWTAWTTTGQMEGKKEGTQANRGAKSESKRESEELPFESRYSVKGHTLL